MRKTFHSAYQFNGDISKWDTSRNTNLGGTFHKASVFNGDISKWDTSKVWKFGDTFSSAYKFNADISKWDVAGNSFQGASSFFLIRLGSPIAHFLKSSVVFRHMLLRSSMWNLWLQKHSGGQSQVFFW